jgi:hypothetical protein
MGNALHSIWTEDLVVRKLASDNIVPESQQIYVGMIAIISLWKMSVSRVLRMANVVNEPCDLGQIELRNVQSLRKSCDDTSLKDVARRRARLHTLLSAGRLLHFSRHCSHNLAE